MKELFLDANAHVPMNHKAMQAFCDLNGSLAGHGHPLSPSFPGQAAAKALEEARERIAKSLGAISSNQIYFAHGCTQACEWGMQMLGQIKKNPHCFAAISPLEHPAVSMAAEHVFGDKSEYRVGIDEMQCDCFANLLPFEEPPEDKPAFKKIHAICIHMQNEIGTIQDFAALHSMGLQYIFSDMSQSLGKMPLNITESLVDMAAFGAHKFGGPIDVGFVYCRDTNNWCEYGYGSRYGLDATGTPNVAGIVSAAVALEDALETLPERQEKMIEFRDVIEPGFKEMGFTIIAEGRERCPNTTFVQLPPTKNSHAILHKLGEIGIHCGLGSACGSLHADKSVLMEKMGLDSDATKYMRISQWGEYGKKEAEYFISRLDEII